VTRPPYEVADIVRQNGDRFLETHQAWLTGHHRRVLRALPQCRTAALYHANRLLNANVGAYYLNRSCGRPSNGTQSCHAGDGGDDLRAVTGSRALRHAAERVGKQIQPPKALMGVADMVARRWQGESGLMILAAPRRSV
jgi:hypothetical protein